MVAVSLPTRVRTALYEHNRPTRPYLATSQRRSFTLATGAIAVQVMVGFPNAIGLAALLGAGIYKGVQGIRRWSSGRVVVKAAANLEDKPILKAEMAKLNKPAKPASKAEKIVKGAAIGGVLVAAALIDWIATASLSNVSIFTWTVLGLVMLRSHFNQKAESPDTEKILTEKLAKKGTMI